MIPRHATGQVLARDGCLLRIDTASAAELKADADPVLLSHNESAERRVVVCNVRRSAMLSRNVANRVIRRRISGADVSVCHVAIVALR